MLSLPHTNPSDSSIPLPLSPFAHVGIAEELQLLRPSVPTSDEPTKCAHCTRIVEDKYRVCERCRERRREKEKRKRERKRAEKNWPLKPVRAYKAPPSTALPKFKTKLAATTSSSVASAFGTTASHKTAHAPVTSGTGKAAALPHPPQLALGDSSHPFAELSSQNLPSSKEVKKPTAIVHRAIKAVRVQAKIRTSDKEQRPSRSPAADGYVHYQTSTEMLDALSGDLKGYYAACLSSAVPPAHVNFRGTYSIIANPAIEQWKRVRFVSEDLRKIAKLPHSNREYLKSLSKQNWTETFQCDCSRGRNRAPAAPSVPDTCANPPAPLPSLPTFSVSTLPLAAGSAVQVHHGWVHQAPPLPATAPVLRTPAKSAPFKRQGSLANWIVSSGSGVKKTKVESLAAMKESMVAGSVPLPEEIPGCGGKIHISACEDASHWLGHLVMGQTIKVEVVHPKAEENAMDMD